MIIATLRWHDRFAVAFETLLKKAGISVQLKSVTIGKTEFMRYQGKVFRPSCESESLIIQATIGCPHNKCVFCGMYQDREFAFRQTSEIIEDLDMAHEVYGDDVKSLFLADGNSMAMEASSIIEVCSAAKSRFPQIQTISMYASPKYLAEKTEDELKAIADAGVNRIYSGLESGNQETFDSLEKGVPLETAIDAYRKVKQTEIELHVFLMIGIAGLDVPQNSGQDSPVAPSEEKSQKHALESAAAINQISPHFLHLQTYVPLTPSKDYESFQRKKRILLSPYQALREMYWLIESIQVPVNIVAEHFSNFMVFSGDLPSEQAKILDMIESALSWPVTEFRPRVEFEEIEDED